MKKKLISIVIPVYNEEAVLDELKKRLQQVMKIKTDYDFEVIIVEHGSWDSSFEKLVKMNKEDQRFKIIQLSRNFGYENAITAGLKHVQGDAVAIMNADLQDPPEMIPKFIEKWNEGYEIVYGIIKKRKGVSLKKRILASLFYKVIYVLTNKVVPKDVSDFRLIDKKVYSVVNQMKEKNKFLRGIIVWTGFKQVGIPFERPPRYAGESKFNFSTIITFAMNGIFSFSYFPLKIALGLGFLMTIGSFIAMLIEISIFLKYGRVVPGFTTIVLATFFLFGILFFVLGIIGIYIARIYEELKQRPDFIVNNKIGF